MRRKKKEKPAVKAAPKETPEAPKKNGLLPLKKQRRRMKVDILSLFPDYFKGPFDVSIIKKAREKGILEINLIDIRSFASNKHAKVDDRPYGGGPGMVLMPEPVCDAIRSVKQEGSYVVYLSPQGKKLDAQSAKSWQRKSI